MSNRSTTRHPRLVDQVHSDNKNGDFSRPVRAPLSSLPSLLSLLEVGVTKELRKFGGGSHVNQIPDSHVDRSSVSSTSFTRTPLVSSAPGRRPVVVLGHPLRVARARRCRGPRDVAGRSVFLLPTTTQRQKV